MKQSKFYICSHCGNVAEMVYDGGVVPFCCGEPMKELIPNTVEASGEKHIPEVLVREHVVEVQVGSVEHPMQEAHYIEWIQVNTEKGSHRRYLKPGEEPKVVFQLGEEQAESVYAYCNLHGLWAKELK